MIGYNKFCSVASAVLALLLTVDIVNGQATLAQKWNITDPTFDYDSLSFDLDYGVSDWVTNGEFNHGGFSYGIYDENCKEGGYEVPTNVISSNKNSLPATRGDGTGRRVAQVNFEINPETISADPNIYEETIVNGEQFAIITVCVRFSLNTHPDIGIEVNFHETIVILNVDLTDGFTIDEIDVTPRDALITTANQVYEVEGYQCNNQYEELNTVQKAVTRNQGAIIRVCVRPTQEGRDDGIYMREIQSFSFSRVYGDARPDVNQVAIENSAPANNGLTDLFCENGWEVCAFETILFAAFYRDSGAVSGAGIASMQFGGSGNRQRQLRSLQDGAGGEEAAVAEFELDFETVATVDAPNSAGVASSGVPAMMLLAISAAMALF